MKYLFIVQGEGRGHMTQALALSEIITAQGHELVAVCVGSSKRRSIPSFFTTRITAPLHLFSSPNFVTDTQNRKINLSKTIIKNLTHLSTFAKSLRTLNDCYHTCKPDVIVNFYEPLTGIYKIFYRPKCKVWSIGHQYLILHPEFTFPKGRSLERLFFTFFTHLTALGSEKLLALSFRPFEDVSRSRVKVVPPLLRNMVREFPPKTGDFYLTYMVNSGYAQQVIAFASRNPKIKIEAFWDNNEIASPYTPLPNLVFHFINDYLFLAKMSACKGFLTTAGFESICEAMFYGKPVWMVPLEGQYEQYCNAHDALLADAGFIGQTFDFMKFDRMLVQNQYQKQTHDWLDKFPTYWKNLNLEKYNLEKV